MRKKIGIMWAFSAIVGPDYYLFQPSWVLITTINVHARTKTDKSFQGSHVPNLFLIDLLTVDYVFASELCTLHDPGHVYSWVGSVMYRSCTTSINNNGR